MLHVLLKRRFLPSLPVLRGPGQGGASAEQIRASQVGADVMILTGCWNRQGKSCGGGHTWRSIGCEVCVAAEAASCAPSWPALKL